MPALTHGRSGDREQESSPSDTGPESSQAWCFVTGLSTSDGEKKRNKTIVRAHASRRSWSQQKIKAVRRTQSKTSGSGRERSFDIWTSERHKRGQRDLRAKPSSSSQQHHPHTPTPASFAVSGAATSFDPFETYPCDLSRKFVDRLMPSILSQTSKLLPPLKPGDGTERRGIFTAAWVRASIHDRAMFHAALFASLFNSRVLMTNPVQSREELFCYHIAVQEINRRLTGPKLTVTDEAIQSVCCLAFHGDVISRTPCKSPRQGPFRTLQLLDHYGGTVSPSTLHTDGLRMMVGAKGGLGSLRFDGLPQLVCYVDILCANRGPRRPVFTFISQLESPEDELGRAAAAHDSMSALGTGFSALDLILDPKQVAHLKLVLRQMCEYTAALDHFATESHHCLSLGMLADMRNFVQHSLLSLSPQDSLERHTVPPLIEMCHAAALVYSWIVIFPAPAQAIPFHHAATQIKTLLNCEEVNEYWPQTPDLMLWIVVMGAIASFGSIEEQEYITFLGRVFQRLKIDTWHGLKSQLEKFLWYPSVSDVDGYDLWQEILETGFLHRGAGQYQEEQSLY